MKSFNEQRLLAWEEFAKHSIELPNPATALMYQSLFYAGYGAGFTDGQGTLPAEPEALAKLAISAKERYQEIGLEQAPRGE